MFHFFWSMVGPSNSSSKVLTQLPAAGGRLPSQSGSTAGGAAAVIDSIRSFASPWCLAVTFTAAAASLVNLVPVPDRFSQPPQYPPFLPLGEPFGLTAGAKGTTMSCSAPAASGAAAVTRSVGPPLLVTWTLGVHGKWPSFFSLTRTSVASRRSHRPAGGFRATDCSPF